MLDQQASSQDSSTQDVLLEARDIYKTFAKREKRRRGPPPPLVLDNIQVKIHTGEFVALLGPSGSGKSTLLRILAGLLQPTTGQVLFKGVPQHGANPHLAIVFQSFALFPWLTVLQNVELGLQAQDLTRTQRLKLSLAAIDLIGLDGFEGIVFAGRNLLERGGMNHDRDSRKCAFQTLGITNITDEIAQARMIKPRSPHVMLLEFVTAEDDELLRAVFAQHELDELPAKRTRPAGDQYNLFGPVHDVIPRSECIFPNNLHAQLVWFTVEIKFQRQYSGDKPESNLGNPR